LAVQLNVGDRKIARGSRCSGSTTELNSLISTGSLEALSFSSQQLYTEAKTNPFETTTRKRFWNQLHSWSHCPSSIAILSYTSQPLRET